MSKIVFITNSEWNHRDEERFGIEIFRKYKMEVTVLDCTDILRPQLRANFTPPDPLQTKYVDIIDNWNDLRDHLEKLSSNTVILPLLRAKSVFNLIQEFKLDSAVTFRGSLPPPIAQSKKEMFHKKFFRLLQSPYETIYKIKEKIHYELESFKSCPVKYFFYGAKRDWELFSKYRNIHTKCTALHALDYDIFLEQKKRLITEDHIVFLDEFMPFHPEFTEIPLGLDPNMYYQKLENFFQYVEDTLSLPVVIAAHPRSNYLKYPDYFRDFQIIRGQACKLVRRSKLVLSHASASLSFPVIYKKPVLFLTNNDIGRTRRAVSIFGMAKAFGKKPYNLDAHYKPDFDSELMVSNNHYRLYKENYIKIEGSPERPSWEIVAQTLLGKNVN